MASDGRRVCPLAAPTRSRPTLSASRPLPTSHGASSPIWERAYGVAVTDDVALAHQVNNPREDAVAAVRLVPRAADAATLTFVFSSFPGVDLEAGAAFSDRFPSCGCDACDESVDDEARRLEDVVFGIVAGGLTETTKGWLTRGLAFSLTMAGRSRAGWVLPRVGDKKSIRAISRRIRSRRGKPWAPWTPCAS